MLTFVFLTTGANAEVGTFHPKATPVILRDQREVDRWLRAGTSKALELQRPLFDGVLNVVTGEHNLVAE